MEYKKREVGENVRFWFNSYSKRICCQINILSNNKMSSADSRTTEEFSLPPDVQAQYEQFMRKSELNIVIWGPRFSNDPVIKKLYAKRIQIQQKIVELGHTAVLGEEDKLVNKLQQSGLNLFCAEFIEANHADYIICFMASPGSIGEVHDFAMKFTEKMMICINSEYYKSYSGQGILAAFEGKNGKLDWFKHPEDIDGCHLAGRVIKQIKQVNQAKQFELVSML
jgi:hypothetical protein